MWHAFHLETGKAESMFIWMKKKAQITWVIPSQRVHFPSLFAHYNRITQMKHPYISNIHTSTSQWLLFSSDLVACSPKDTWRKLQLSPADPAKSFLFCSSDQEEDHISTGVCMSAEVYPNGWFYSSSEVCALVHRRAALRDSEWFRPLSLIMESY